MATFLTTTDTSASIERVIRNAKQELTLISAYVYPRVIYLQRLRDAAERGVRITLIFGKRQMDRKVMDLFRQIDNLSIYYLHELHAKCFVNEEEAIITSLNLLNGSEEKNREMGVRLERSRDPQAYNDCVAEIKSILAEAKPVSLQPKTERSSLRSKSRQAAEPLPEQGHCIRCGKQMGFAPHAPLCHADYAVWKHYDNVDFQEKHCHMCGEASPVSRRNPLCPTCAERYAVATGGKLKLFTSR